MSKVDDELRRRLHQAERPVDVDAVFEGLEHRRSHRERVRRVQAALLAFVVVAATAGGFLFLRHAFDPDRQNVGGERTSSVTNGEIVFSRPLPDGSQHLFAVQPGVVGERLITSGGGIYADPSVAPDGRVIAVVYASHSRVAGPEGAIATLPIMGGEPTSLTEEFARVGDPSWSPDGSRIAFAAASRPADFDAIYVMNADGSDRRLVVKLERSNLSAPDWSPDGETLVFVGLEIAQSEVDVKQPDLYTVGIDGNGLRNLTESRTINESTPSWSPNGDLIAYHRNEGGTSNSIQLIDTSGRPAGTFFDGADASEIGELDWSPDGRVIAFTSSLALTETGDDRDLDVWTVRMDGNQLANLTTDGASGISWQPLPAGSQPQPSATSEPTVSPSAEPAGRDIGHSFNLCGEERLGGIDFLGDGTSGTAWIGVRTNADGTCPRNIRPGRYVVAEDHTGDGVADSWLYLPWLCYVDCVPFDATDLDANGTEELIVASYFSIMDYYVMGLQPNADGALEIRPLLVADPGHEPVGLVAGEPLRIDAGGDEGYGSQIECDGYPEAPVLIWSWSNQPVETNLPREVHITRLQLRSDGLFHVVATNDYTVPAGQPSGIQRSTAPACGVDFHPNA